MLLTNLSTIMYYKYMINAQGNNLECGDYVQTISPINFGKEGNRRVGIVVETTDVSDTEGIGIVFGIKKYVLFRVISHCRVSKITPDSLKVAELNIAREEYEEMKEVVAIA